MRIFAILLLTGSLFGQRLLYNQDLDKKGQDAAAAAKKLASDPLTSKELQNLSIVEKQQVDAAIQDGFTTMRFQVESFGTWHGVSRSVCTELLRLYAPDEVAALSVFATDADCSNASLASKKSEYLKRIEALKAKQDPPAAEKTNSFRSKAVPATVGKAARFKSLATNPTNPPNTVAATKQKAAPAGQATAPSCDAAAAGAKPVTFDQQTKTFVGNAVDQINNFKDLLQFAQNLKGQTATPQTTPGITNAVDEIEKGIQEVGDLLESAGNIWSTYICISVDPHSLVPSKEKLAVSLLAVDAARIKELAAIRAANALYLNDLRVRLEDSMGLLLELNLWLSPDQVETSLSNPAAANKTLLDYKNERRAMIYALYLASAGAAVNQTPFAVQNLRESLAQRRSAIRRDAVYNGAYEVALRAAGQRLSAYYAAGVKPTQIAGLLYYLAGIVSLPKLAF